MTNKGPQIPKALLARPGVQLMVFVFTVLYVVSPVDVIPDVMPLIGWMDDAAVFLAQLASFVIYLKHKRREYAAKHSGSADKGDSNGS